MIVPAATLRRVVKALARARRGAARATSASRPFPVRLPAALAGATGEHVALLVSRVEPDSPAARAGLLLGDALLSLGGEQRSRSRASSCALLAEDRIGERGADAARCARARCASVTVTVGARGRRRRRP